jgi:hypothetical protein
MSDHLGQATLVAVLILGAGGCGASSSSPTPATSATTATTQASTPTQPNGPTSTTALAKTTRSNAARHRSSTPHRSSTTQTTSTTRRTTTQASSTTAATATTTATVRTAPAPTPAGTAAAPAGLTQTTGYGTYELCASGCTGSVPAALRRPLRIPNVASGASCRTSGGSGPVRPLGSAQLAVSPLIGSAWRGGRVTWSSASSYTGPVLIRGRQLGGPGAVGFGEGRVPYDELQLLAQGMSAPRAPGGGREWLSFTRVRSPGCYAYQVDGTSFSTVVVFRAEG